MKECFIFIKGVRKFDRTCNGFTESTPLLLHPRVKLCDHPNGRLKGDLSDSYFADLTKSYVFEFEVLSTPSVSSDSYTLFGSTPYVSV